MAESKGGDPVLAAARRLGTTVGWQVQPLPHGARSSVTEILTALGETDVRVVVLPARDGAARCWRVLESAAKPVLVVPPRMAVDGCGGFGTALVPLDGTAESAAAVTTMLDLLQNSGVRLVVLHVFGADTVPAHWDQGVYAEEAWEAEFRARFCPSPTVRLALRRGHPGSTVVQLAKDEGADLIALGWSQHLAKGHAATVRHTVSLSAVPVLLVPAAS